MPNIELAEQYFQQGNFVKAGQVYQQMLMNDKHDISALWGLGNVAIATNSYQRAYDIFQRCISLNAQSPQLYLSSAQACIHLTLFKQAEQLLIKAYQLNPKLTSTLFKLATFYCESGNYEECCKYIEEWRIIEPDSISAFGLLVRLNKLSLGDDQNIDYITRMQLKLNDSFEQITKQQQITLNYSFAELNHKAKQYNKAFSYFERANNLQRASIDFSVNDMKSYFKSLINVFDQSLFETYQTLKNEEKIQHSLTPIFIVGQPRTGSTLLEQMLLGHEKISSGGELAFLAGDIAQGIYQLTGKEFPEACSLLNSTQCDQLAAHYLKNLQTLDPSANYIIDKMPANFQSIGLIKMLMPHAKVIHITRDPIDVSWSIFRNNFESLEPYFCSLPEIAQYHQLYQSVMAHWEEVIPDFFHTVSYDNLVSNPEKEIKNILSFCQLDFQDNCLGFSQETRHIRTLSDVQLREGIVNNRTNSWLPYKAFLKPLFDALN